MSKGRLNYAALGLPEPSLRILHVDTTHYTLTGAESINPTTMSTYVIEGMGIHDKIEVQVHVDNAPTASAGNRNVIVLFGDTTTNYIINEGLSNGIAVFHGSSFVCNDGAADSQFISGAGGFLGETGGWQRSTAADKTFSVDTTQNVNIHVRLDPFEVGDTMTIKRVEIILHVAP